MNRGDFLLAIFVETLFLGVLPTSIYQDYEKRSASSQVTNTVTKNNELPFNDHGLLSYEESRDKKGNINEDFELSYSSNDGAVKSESDVSKSISTEISWTQNPGILAAIICACLVIGFLLLLLALFCVYRMRKRDEGSYALDEPKKMLPPSSEYSKAPTREFYA